MFRFTLAAASIAAALVAVAPLAAAPTSPSALEECFQGSHRHALNGKAILDGLDLTRDQKRGLAQRLITYPWTNKPSGQFSAGMAPQPKGFGGLGLSSSTIATIWARIHAQEAGMSLDQPAGWPCEPFVSSPQVISFARQTLVYNGFHPNATFQVLNSRQITFDAIRDGVEYTGAIVKSGPREIAMRITEVPTIGHSTTPGPIDRFTTVFDA